jgi:hypothetical protein
MRRPDTIFKLRNFEGRKYLSGRFLPLVQGDLVSSKVDCPVTNINAAFKY